jgi:hypothetical protein
MALHSFAMSPSTHSNFCSVDAPVTKGIPHEFYLPRAFISFSIVEIRSTVRGVRAVKATTSENRSFAALASAMDAADPVTATPASILPTNALWSCVVWEQHEKVLQGEKVQKNSGAGKDSMTKEVPL